MAKKDIILAPNGLKVGQTIISGKNVAPEVGNTLPFSEIPLGAIIHNIELHPGRGGVIVRSAGASAQFLAREDRYAVIKLPSGETRQIVIAMHGYYRHRFQCRSYFAKLW